MTDDFVSSDLGVSASNLRKDCDPEKRTYVPDEIDREKVPRRLMDILDIRNWEKQTIGITQGHINEITGYLQDLIIDCPIELATPGVEPQEHILFTQPGIRYCQAQALVHSLMKDQTFMDLGEEKKSFVADRILEEVRGRMMENIILLETIMALPKQYKVVKFQFPRSSGEYDMVIYDTEAHCAAAYEIKHSRKAVPEQARHLVSEEKRELTEQRFGDLVGRYVLYLGENRTAENGVVFQNAEEYLKDLPRMAQDQVINEEMESGGPTMTM